MDALGPIESPIDFYVMDGTNHIRENDEFGSIRYYRIINDIGGSVYKVDMDKKIKDQFGGASCRFVQSKNI